MDNFYETARRMLTTSRILHNNSDYHNSCYTAGYVIECYAKAIVETYSTLQPKTFSHNINRLNIELQSILGGNSSLSSHIVDGSVDFNNMFNGWNPVLLRYVEKSNELDVGISDKYQVEIDLAMQKLTKMKIDGFI